MWYIQPLPLAMLNMKQKYTKIRAANPSRKKVKGHEGPSEMIGLLPPLKQLKKRHLIYPTSIHLEG
jgi:hypothetical protein